MTYTAIDFIGCTTDVFYAAVVGTGVVVLESVDVLAMINGAIERDNGHSDPFKDAA